MNFFGNLLAVALVATSLASVSCRKPKVQPTAEESKPEVYQVNSDGTELSYSDWHDVLDTSLSVQKLSGSASCWIRLEGRDHNGLSQFRWVNKQMPVGQHFRYGVVYNNSVEKYYEEGKKWHGKGYDRVSLQVFMDASGVARYQSIWISPAQLKESIAKPSVLDPELQAAREESFTPWESRSESRNRFEEVKLGKSVLYLETRERDETRVIYSEDPTFGYYTRWWCGELLYLRHCKEYEKQGYKLLTTSISERKDFRPIYSGVWVKEKDFPKALEALKKYGISPAEQIPIEEIEEAHSN